MARHRRIRRRRPNVHPDQLFFVPPAGTVPRSRPAAAAAAAAPAPAPARPVDAARAPRLRPQPRPRPRRSRGEGGGTRERAAGGGRRSRRRRDGMMQRRGRIAGAQHRHRGGRDPVFSDESRRPRRRWCIPRYRQQYGDGGGGADDGIWTRRRGEGNLDHPLGTFLL